MFEAVVRNFGPSCVFESPTAIIADGVLTSNSQTRTPSANNEVKTLRNGQSACLLFLL